MATLGALACTFTFAAGAIDLAIDTTHGPVGVYAPGVYCVTGAQSIGTAGITLSGSGNYVFRSTGALNTVANSAVTLANGADACNVFWTPVATTLGANSKFIGTDIDNTGITTGGVVTWLGRALDFATTVTTGTTNTITVPTCGGKVVGGTNIPIDMSALLVAGVVTNAGWILPAIVIGGAGVGLATMKRKNVKQFFNKKSE